MTKAIYKYKVVFTDADNKTTTSYHCNASEIKKKYGIARSSLFHMLDAKKKDIEKHRRYKITRCNIPKYVKTENVIND